MHPATLLVQRTRRRKVVGDNIGNRHTDDISPPEPPETLLGTVTPLITGPNDATFGGGTLYPAGTYRIRFVNGAFIYNLALDWTVNRPPGFQLYRIRYGAVGLDNMPSIADQPSQAAAEAAMLAAMPNGQLITHPGGTIAIRFQDLDYFDNVAGSPNPTWALYSIP